MPEHIAMTAGESEQAVPSGANIDAVQIMGLLFAWNAEITGFYLNRCQQYWTLPLRLQRCSTLADVQRLQIEFLRELAENYRDVVLRLSEIVSGPSHKRLGQEEYAAALQKGQRDAALIIEQAKSQAERILASAEERLEKTGEQRPLSRTEKTA